MLARAIKMPNVIDVASAESEGFSNTLNATTKAPSLTPHPAIEIGSADINKTIGHSRLNSMKSSFAP